MISSHLDLRTITEVVDGDSEHRMMKKIIMMNLMTTLMMMKMMPIVKIIMMMLMVIVMMMLLNMRVLPSMEIRAVENISALLVECEELIFIVDNKSNIFTQFYKKNDLSVNF